MGRNRGKFYVNPEDLKKDISEYQQTNVISESLGIKLMLIAERYSKRWNLKDYTNNYRGDFIGDAILRMVKQINKIDLSHPKCNPFSYLSTTCENAIKAFFNKENKYNRAKESLTEYYFNEVEQNEGISFKKNDED